jgi:hypothetical protein
VPVLRFGEQGLDPDLPFAHGLLIRRRGVIAPHALQIVGVERAVDDATVVALGTCGLDWASVAGRGPGRVDDHFLTVLGRLPLQRMVLRTAVLVSLGVVREVSLREERRPSRPQIGARDVGTDTGVLEGDDVLDRPVVVSPVTCSGRSVQRNRARHSRSSIGWFSMTSRGITSAERTIRALPRRRRSGRGAPGGSGRR